MSLVPTSDQQRTPALAGHLTEGQLETLRRTIAHDLTDDELALFAAVCQRTGLDPFAKQIYAIKRTSRRKVRGQWVDEDVLTIQTGIDGFRLAAQRSALYAGQDPPEWCGPDGQWTEVWLSDEPPAAARVAVYRKDFARPVVGVAKFDSYADRWPANDAQKAAGQLGDLRNLWKTMPEQMIAKCAEALALRKAFPNDLSGIYATEEMTQADSRPIDTGAREGISERDFDEIREAASLLSDEQRGELHAWCESEGIEVARARLTSEGAHRVMGRILDLARGAMDVPSGPATSASPSPGSADGGEGLAARIAPAGSGGTGGGSSASGQSQMDLSASATTASDRLTGRDGSTDTQHAPSGAAITADQIRAAVHARHPDRDTTRKQDITAAKIAAQVAGALSIEFAGGFDDVVADQQLAAAVLADLAGDDKPPPPGGNGPAVGEQPPAQAPGSGPALAAPAPTADPVALKVEHPSDWRKENARCQALAAEHLSGDPDTLKSQREALAYQASGGRVTSWAEVTRGEFSQVRSWLEFIADGHGRLVESDVAAHLGWAVQIGEAA